jgi:hypothetical protein
VGRLRRGDPVKVQKEELVAPPKLAVIPSSVGRSAMGYLGFGKTRRVSPKGTIRGGKMPCWGIKASRRCVASVRGTRKENA